MRLTVFRNLWRQIAKPSQLDHSTKSKFLPYGEGANGGSFPLRLADLVKKSPTASACISTKADYIKGEGFNDQNLEAFKINPRQSFLSFHDHTADSQAFIEGFAWCVKYDKTFKINAVYPVAFENLRLGAPDSEGFIGKILYNPFFGTSLYHEKDTCPYDVFNPDPEVVKLQMMPFIEKGDYTGYKGQILYYGKVSALNRFYSEPGYYSCKDAMESDRRISQYRKENLAGGLLQTFMLIMKGRPNDPTKNPLYEHWKDDQGNIRPMTKGEEFDLYMSEAFMGSDRVGNMIVQWVDEGEEKPEILPFPTFANEDAVQKMKSDVIKEITIATKTPAVLANIHEGVSLGGDGNMIRAAVKLMQQRVKPDQRILIEHYKMILSHWTTSVSTDIEIVPYNPFPEMETVDSNVWSVLTVEEKRQWVRDHTEIKLIDVQQPAQQPPAPTEQPALPEPQALLINSLHTDYPDGARTNARKAMEWMDKTGIKCGGAFGRELANKISEGLPLSFKDLKRIKSFLTKNERYLDSPFDKGCDGVLANQWGGRDMLKWVESRVTEVQR